MLKPQRGCYRKNKTHYHTLFEKPNACCTNKGGLILNLSKLYGKKVIVHSNDGKVYIGFVDSYTPANDNDGIEAISLSSGVWLDEIDIKSIKITS